jgi:serine kinase of HPr protein (carbohydrate metabolism regulator)
VHQNIVAVATLKEHAGIILINSCEPAKDTLEKAIQENVPILVSDLSAFELTGRIYNLLNSGK